MPKEKKPKLTPNSNSQHETRVLLEEIRSEVKTVSEQHGSIMEKLQEHDQRFEKIQARLEKIELKQISHDGKFEKIELKQISHDGKFDRIEKVITTVMSDHETRIKKLEDKAVMI